MRASFGRVSKEISIFSGVAVLLFSLVFSFLPQAAHAVQGSFTHYSIPNSAPQFITAGPDGNVWATLANSSVARITADGQITQFPVDDPNNNILLSGITTGPDGNLWAAEAQSDKINRITPDGVVTRFTNDFGLARGIVTGPDDNLWFTSDNGVGKMTPAGVMTSYPFPTACGCFGITVGADNNLWVAESATGKIAKITTAGVITEYTVATPGSSPGNIATGFDGNVWFTDQGSGMIGKITPAGVITEYSLPSGFTSPYAIARGFGQDLWVADGSNGTLGRILPDGTVSVLPTSGSLAPLHMAAGPNGNLWFTEEFDDSVATMVIDATPPVITTAPTITPGTTTLSGTVNEPGSTLVLTLADGTTLTTTSDSSGNFSFSLPSGGLTIGDVLSISATDLSDNTTVTPFQITVAATVTPPASSTPDASSDERLANTGTPLVPIVLTALATMTLSVIWLVRRYTAGSTARKYR